MEYPATFTTRQDTSRINPGLRLVLLGEWSNVASIEALEIASGVDSQSAGFESDTRVKHGLLYHLWHQFLNLILVLIVVVVFVWFGPGVWYQVTSSLSGTPLAVGQSTVPQKWPGLSQGNNGLTGSVVTPVAGQSAVEPVATQSGITPTPVPIAQPPYNPDLPDGDWLVIPRIGIRSELRQDADYNKALAVGLWQVPEYGKAGSQDAPMIVAGHRYGWDWWWKTDYWKYHSFYLLPQLEKGDRIEVISDHRKWIYQVYATEEGTQITDYGADLILYTCKDLSSPIRFFRYAKLVDTSK